ncbi:IclR family transcriptional regulator [Novosphingobium sp.]|uniref:IclR family transcriptional regulator n=1 Tax=Novosphingobium sp. TaxID=1874826 RepID=UPI002735A432|nr:IclR family transcriptional regulator [Novosphingobium sp.]MDP3908523.1 IclR family transcriptional regulator [Novosphingobium sp.]
MATPEIKSVGKAFALLDCLAAEDDCVSLPSMAKRCGLSVATAHRLLATLEALGAVVHTGPGQYAIGLRMLDLTRRSSFETLLASATMPILSRITRTTGSTAHVAVLDSERMVTYIARSANRANRIPTTPGIKLEAYCSGLGKVLLADLSTDDRDTYLADGPFPPLTARTIITPEALDRELAAIRDRRFAVDDCEMFDNLRCVAVPILHPDGRVIAALSASQDSTELSRAQIQELVTQLTGHAAAISTKLFRRGSAPRAAH